MQHLKTFLPKELSRIQIIQIGLNPDVSLGLAILGDPAICDWFIIIDMDIGLEYV